MNLYEDVDIISFIRLSRLRWIGHMNKMDKKRKVYNTSIIRRRRNNSELMNLYEDMDNMYRSFE